MNGFGGLNKAPNGVVIGLAQLPAVATPDDLACQTRGIFPKPARRFGERLDRAAE